MEFMLQRGKPAINLALCPSLDQRLVSASYFALCLFVCLFVFLFYPAAELIISMLSNTHFKNKTGPNKKKKRRKRKNEVGVLLTGYSRQVTHQVPYYNPARHSLTLAALI